MAERKRPLAGILPGVLLTALLTGSVIAASVGPWAIDTVTGPAVYRSGDSWQELAANQQLTSPFIRTLRNGGVRLQSNGVFIAVGANSIVNVTDGAQGVSILHYLGDVAIAAQGQGLALTSGALQLTGLTGVVVVSVDERGAAITLDTGTATVAFKKGKPVNVTAGQLVAADFGTQTLKVSSGSDRSAGAMLAILESDERGASHAANASSGSNNASSGASNASSGANNASSGANNASSGSNNASSGGSNASSGGSSGKGKSSGGG